MIMGLPSWSNLIGLYKENIPLMGYANFPILKKQYMNKIIDGMIYDSEIDKWVTVEEYNKEYDIVECSADQDWEWYYASE